ncbi:SigE family RNA polymerase sigma factor [Ornithinimicrobium humiphilum]|jgi:RNA polymerase sigma-70 factor (sigma-E family)|uniref:RNA polymerase sigma-70 factor (Sigma-E family) n=1 Tax=Ornithinimicrobium humiphilum TaxID=125288 RepID=A0A543KNR4_9MICO|nr:SigE family RNA polymerase sigma factor [Ornithinimicrobium humiphilum]TQM96704.1 RNA polymerase sigma-70 factor (sigma-E family) [Ornithinimicrobium humiphilum]
MTQGSEDDFVAFVRARQGALLRSAYLICGDHHLAQDLLQDALVKLASRWERLRDERPEAYVRRILYRDAISRWRRLRREHLADHQDPGGLFGSHEAPDGTASWLTNDEIRRALVQLPPRQRAVIVLRYYEDLSEVQIAEALNIAPGTVKSQASDALRKLRRLIPAIDETAQELR